ncbi:hypothetical protein [Bartonella sp. AR 15-3]|nr:hypothetical protein [Bartonella sp. AR 15-3]OPB32184.1 hypothetical protein BAR153v2_011650 [Bartonella sp. AR 15-3]
MTIGLPLLFFGDVWSVNRANLMTGLCSCAQENAIDKRRDVLWG